MMLVTDSLFSLFYTILLFALVKHMQILFMQLVVADVSFPEMFVLLLPLLVARFTQHGIHTHTQIVMSCKDLHSWCTIMVVHQVRSSRSERNKTL